MTTHPWPLSEVTNEEAEQILALTKTFRDKRILQLKRDIENGTHAKRKLMHEREANR